MPALKYLTQTELDGLMKVFTTPEQAHQIKERNTPLYEFLQTLPTTLEGLREIANKYEKNHRQAGFSISDFEFSGRVGCPHCTHCNVCEWKAYPYTTSAIEMCGHATFGGISLRDVRNHPFVSIIYRPNMESIDFCPRWADYDDKSFHLYLQSLNNCKIFCLAHIEWADAVLEDYFSQNEKRREATETLIKDVGGQEPTT